VNRSGLLFFALKTSRVQGPQRGRGRSGGRPVRARGRIRKRGPRGGGTVRSWSPQQGHRPSSLMGPVASARSQWPRASHDGLMHCTVNPGKYCIRVPPAAGLLDLAPSGVRSAPCQPKKSKGWRGLWRKAPVVSSKNTTRCRGQVAEAPTANISQSIAAAVPHLRGGTKKLELADWTPRLRRKNYGWLA
jgi:hypothetical protein